MSTTSQRRALCNKLFQRFAHLVSEAIESADVVLIKSDPADVSKLVNLSKATMRKMKQNLLWASGYNALAISIAARILFPWGIFMRPEWGALIMSASSIIVVVNVLLLKGEKLQ